MVDFIIRIRTFVTLDCADSVLGSCIQVPPKQEKPGKDHFEQAAPGSSFLQHADGCLFLLYFQCIWIFLPGFSSMYGSLTTIILIMLWLYVCMYIILLGGEVNALLERFYVSPREKTEAEDKEEKPEEKS